MLKAILQGMTRGGPKQDTVRAAINPGEARLLKALGGADTTDEHGVHHFFTSANEGGGAGYAGGGSRNAYSGPGGASGGTRGGNTAAKVVNPVVRNQTTGAVETAAGATPDAVSTREFSSNQSEPISPNLNNPRTQNLLRSFVSGSPMPGSTPYVSDPSIGQLAGLFTTALPIVGTLNNLGGAAYDAYNGSGFGDVYDGGLFGSALDKIFGSTPGKITGYTNPDANQGFRASKGDPLSNVFASNARPTIFDSDLVHTLFSPKIYSSNDASVIR